MILCECGEFIKGEIFKDYIKTSVNPSTATIGHKKCGMIFDFIDENKVKKYSSRKELKSLAMKFAQKRNMDYKILGEFLLEVDRLKSSGKLSDSDIIILAYERL